MKKLSNLLFFILSGYILPLLFAPELIFSWKILVLISACSILVYTQPSIDKNDAQKHNSSDGKSVWLISLLSIPAITAPIIDWAYFSKSEVLLSQVSIFGLVILIFGLGFRLWAINTLGKQFTSVVKIVANHELIQNGPYKFVRHPSYTGSLFSFIGSAIWLESFIGLLICLVCMGVAYYFRIKNEERTLIEAFGKDYLDYQKRTKGLIPFIW